MQGGCYLCKPPINPLDFPSQSWPCISMCGVHSCLPPKTSNCEVRSSTPLSTLWITPPPDIILCWPETLMPASVLKGRVWDQQRPVQRILTTVQGCSNLLSITSWWRRTHGMPSRGIHTVAQRSLVKLTTSSRGLRMLEAPPNMRRHLCNSQSLAGARLDTGRSMPGYASSRIGGTRLSHINSLPCVMSLPFNRPSPCTRLMLRPYKLRWQHA